ncbi:MFS general substrate transporter [Aureobasidium sp. EXF-8845]|nr:MFS general substrate transporter [Aureobasidium sp. EXF-8845]KAI4858020.1 MFS general substrate transporter [Aureobasidium sp. EXF-8846]
MIVEVQRQETERAITNLQESPAPDEPSFSELACSKVIDVARADAARTSLDKVTTLCQELENSIETSRATSEKIETEVEDQDRKGDKMTPEEKQATEAARAQLEEIRKKMVADVHAHAEATAEADRARQHKNEREVDETKSRKEETEKRERVLGSLWKWDEAGPIALWVVFAVFLLVFSVQQTFSIATTPSRRWFPIHFLKSRTMLLLYIGTAVSSTGLALGFTRGDSPIKAAVRLLPYICVYFASVMLSGGLLPASGRYRPLYIITGVMLVIGGALMHTVDVDTSTAKIYGYEPLMAFGSGMSMQVAYSVAVAVVDQVDTLNAVGFVNVGQIGSLAIGLSIAGCLYQNVGFDNIKNAVSAYNFSDAEIRAALGGAHSTILAEGDEALQSLVLGAITATLSDIWVLTIVAGAICLVGGMLMKRGKLKLEMSAGG